MVSPSCLRARARTRGRVRDAQSRLHLLRRQKTVKALRAQRRESLVHEIVALKSYRDQLRATLAGIDAEIAAKNTRLAAHDAESRTGSEEYQRLKTPRAAKKPSRSVADGEK